uniref:Protein C9orf135-like n=1 Tax=Ciona intestinalis TaxID=7719 RepID=F7A573_CIOIN|nr:protein C9orf135-like [Ciona intestinalis]|eukprot:XP_002130464.1 protein C9orf135-like [Ciona intestinalis]
MDYLVIPDFVERKGSLYLRSDHMNYSRSTLNSNWHQAREAEPKNYDINSFPIPPGRNLHTTTYARIGNITDGSLPLPTTKAALEQISLKDDFTEQVTRKNMIDVGSFANADISRNIPSAPNSGFGSVLPRHHPDHDKLHLETTHRADFTAPYPFTPAPECPPEFADNSAAYRKCISQFTDTADYRRVGKNTWQDESGVYANTHEKRRVFPSTNPIPERLTEGLL